MKTLQEITEFVIKAHNEQKRKFGGEFYYVHPIRIANRLLEHSEKVVALLHDVFEDTDYKLEDIKKDFQLEDNEYWALQLLTKKKETTYLQYIKEIKGNKNVCYGKIALKVKIEDLKDNLSDLPFGTQRDKYELALYILTEKE